MTALRSMAERPQPGQGCLQRMYESAAWSDLTIVTPTNNFYVHKSVVCEANEFFKKACSGNFIEAKTNRIELEESAEVVQCLLKHLYEFPKAECMPKHERIDQDSGLDDIVQHLLAVVDLRLAADKYNLPRLGHQALSHFRKIVHSLATEHHSVDLVTVGLATFDLEGAKCLESFRNDIVIAIAYALPRISKNAEALDKLFENMELAKRATKTSTVELAKGETRQIEGGIWAGFSRPKASSSGPGSPEVVGGAVGRAAA